MKVLIVGGGAREHALAWKIQQSPQLTELLAAPGNPGIASLARCVPVRADDLEGLVQLSVAEGIDLVVVGPEDPLAAGVVDRLTRENILAFGPRQAAVSLESSKSFAKSLMMRHGVPTARYEVVSSEEAALEAIRRWDLPVVIKADGLARGRGVTIARTREEAEDAIRRCMVDRVFGESGATLVLEEYLEGQEVSLIGLSDGSTLLPLEPAQDHKQLLDGDQGPNTGGMGCFCPVSFFPPAAAASATNQILRKIIDAMRSEGVEFRGALYAGLMLTSRGPYVIEFNVRFGDPETEVLLPRLKSDLLPLLKACAEGSLSPSLSLEWHKEAAVCVVLASGGYPGSFKTGKPIHGLDKPEATSTARAHNNHKAVYVFHAGTALQDGQVVTNGGRVLAVTALGASLEAAIQNAYTAADSISFEGLHRRNDIGKRRA